MSKITVKKKDIIMRVCKACDSVTAHIGKQDGAVGTTCLQCLVDGGNGYQSFAEWSRWVDPITKKQLLTPRGY